MKRDKVEAFRDDMSSQINATLGEYETMLNRVVAARQRLASLKTPTPRQQEALRELGRRWGNRRPTPATLDVFRKALAEKLDPTKNDKDMVAALEHPWAWEDIPGKPSLADRIRPAVRAWWLDFTADLTRQLFEELMEESAAEFAELELEARE